MLVFGTFFLCILWSLAMLYHYLATMLFTDRHTLRQSQTTVNLTALDALLNIALAVGVTSVYLWIKRQPDPDTTFEAIFFSLTCVTIAAALLPVIRYVLVLTEYLELKRNAQVQSSVPHSPTSTRPTATISSSQSTSRCYALLGNAALKFLIAVPLFFIALAAFDSIFDFQYSRLFNDSTLLKTLFFLAVTIYTGFQILAALLYITALVMQVVRPPATHILRITRIITRIDIATTAIAFFLLLMVFQADYSGNVFPEAFLECMSLPLPVLSTFLLIRQLIRIRPVTPVIPLAQVIQSPPSDPTL